MAEGYVIDAPATPSIPVVGQKDRFPVHRIYCVGRNYAAHAREMGKDPDKEPPFFFLKPADAVLPEGGRMQSRRRAVRCTIRRAHRTCIMRSSWSLHSTEVAFRSRRPAPSITSMGT